MSLDKNLFTLFFKQLDDDPASVDLVDPAGTVHYRKRLAAGPVYRAEVTEPLTLSLLASATSPAALNKVKTLELYNPNSVIELKHTGLLTFKWTFKWGEHEFEWKREACYLIRKPDPAVMVAITKEPTGKIQTTSAQILDYNLNRFDIDDRKGLEIVLLTSLLTFQDYNIASKAPKGSVPTPATPPRANSADAVVVPQWNTAPPIPASSSASPTSKEVAPATPPVREPVSDPAPAYSPPVPTRDRRRSRSPVRAVAAPNGRRSRSPAHALLSAPALPPRAESSPGPRRRSTSMANVVDAPPPSAISRVAEAERGRSRFSVVRIDDDMNAKGYSQFCCNLLKVDDTLMYITIRSSSSKYIDKTMKVAEKTSKAYSKLAASKGSDLHQYVSWDFPVAEEVDPKGKGKAKKKSKKGTPPTAVIVHLSKRTIPELEPKLSAPSTEDVPSASSSHAILAPSRLAGHERVVSEPPPTHSSKNKDNAKAKKEAKGKNSPSEGHRSTADGELLAPVRGRQNSKARETAALRKPPMPRQSSSGRLDIPEPSRGSSRQSTQRQSSIPQPSPTSRSSSPPRHQRSVSAAPSTSAGQSQAVSRTEPISNPFLRPRPSAANPQENAQHRQTWFGGLFGRGAVRAG